MKIPLQITREDVLLAIQQLVTEGYAQNNESTKFDLVHEEVRLPPKVVISLASKTSGHYISWRDFSGGKQSNDFLTKRGFVVEPKPDISPTAESNEFQEKLRYLCSLAFPEEPKGTKDPEQVSQVQQVYKRDPKVVDWVERRANGICEGCKNEAPFVRDDGRPFLEVHHIVRLADGGPDTIENAVALCPNCHRRAHHSQDREFFSKNLWAQPRNE